MCETIHIAYIVMEYNFIPRLAKAVINSRLAAIEINIMIATNDDLLANHNSTAPAARAIDVWVRINKSLLLICDVVLVMIWEGNVFTSREDLT